MKKLFVFLFIIGTLLPLNFIFSQTEEQIKNSLKTLFDLSSSKNYEKAASYIAYSGNDKSRYWADTYKSSSNEELSQVKRICKKIAALNDISDKYDVPSISHKKVNNVDVYTAEVDFSNGEQKLKTEFDFINIDGRFVLTEIN